MLRSKNQILWIVLVALLIVLGFFILGNRNSLISDIPVAINIEKEGNILMKYTATTSVIFGDNIGKISWTEGVMIFEGDAKESARMFFEGFLKPLVDEYIEAEIEKEEAIESIGIPKMILFRHVTSGEWAKNFQPTIFLDVVDTDLSKCFIDDRLRLNLNGEIYWIRLERDEYVKPKTKEKEPTNVWPVIKMEAFEGGWLQPSSFMETINTDISEMINDDRLKLIINSKIYWIKLEED